ncbi:MAG: hypothetical protein PHP54_02555 [Clostridia bacterium]|nr:hypothetical protein [Clostridia bacterium]
MVEQNIQKCIEKYIEYVKLYAYYRTRIAIKANYYNRLAMGKIDKILKSNNWIKIINELLDNNNIMVRLFTASRCIEIHEMAEKCFSILENISHIKQGVGDFYAIDAEMILDDYREQHHIKKEITKEEQETSDREVFEFMENLEDQNRQNKKEQEEQKCKKKRWF